jgi:hypothetical protein
MRNAVSFLKHYLPGTALSRITPAGGAGPWKRETGDRKRSPARLVLAVLLVSGGAVLSHPPDDRQAPADNRQASIPPALSLPGKPDPGLAAIFLPRHAPAGAYRLAVIDRPIEAARDALMAALAPAARVDDPPGAWAVRQADPLEAFGEGGIYDRARLARLFAGKPARLVRAPIERDGHAVASVTLLSPCPDAGLSRLSPATIVILFDVAAARAR